MNKLFLMRKKMLYFGMVIGLGVLVLYEGCRKDTGFYNAKATVHEYSGNTYEFLKSQTGVYDSFLYVMERVNLTDSLKKGSYTVFAATNASFERALADLNRLRIVQGRPLQNLSNISLNQLDSLACRYIIKGVVPSDSMKTQDGIQLYGIRYDYPMHGKLVATNAEGFVEGGPKIVEYSETKGVIYTRQWSTTTTVTIDIKTSNGLVNVLERNHEFGFDEFIQRVNPTVSTPYLGIPLPIPGTIGLEQYDRGGERVAYHDNDASNNGGAYRPTEGVDIENSSNGENGYNVGWTFPLEWMNYTVDIADTGSYILLLRAASPGGDATLHFNIDNKPITHHINILGTGGYQNYVNILTPVELPKGRHVLTIMYDYANYNLRFLKFMPLNKPYPVPGTIPAEEFDPGGEGIGYHDNDAGNNGGKYRIDEGVDIEQNKEGGGYDIGWTNADEWLNYTIEVKETGSYNLAVRVGSPHDASSDGSFRVEVDGEDLTGPMDSPNTGGYQNWTDVTKTVFLEKGKHVMRFYQLSGAYNIRSYTFTAIH